MPANLHDSLPLTGMTVVPSSGFDPGGFPSQFRIYGYHSHINDVELEINDRSLEINDRSHAIWSKRRRIGALHSGNGIIAVGNCILTPLAAYYKAYKYTKVTDTYWSQSVISYLIAQYPRRFENHRRCRMDR